MANYKLAAQAKFRYNTTKGELTTEQLFGLSINDLDELAVSLDIAHKESGKKSFVNKTSPKDKTTKEKFEIVLDVLNTKVEEQEMLTQMAEDKKYNEKILAAIEGAEDEELKGKSKAQLMKMLRK